MNRLAGFGTLLFAVVLAGSTVSAKSQTRAAAKPFAMEFYYKIKWGHLDEFLALYRKNHLPVLRRLQQQGDIVEMSATFPLNHAGEANRWDFRFTIVYRDVEAAHDTSKDDAIIAELYPDQATFQREEQRRFELMMEHMDVPIRVDDLRGWK